MVMVLSMRRLRVSSWCEKNENSWARYDYGYSSRRAREMAPESLHAWLAVPPLTGTYALRGVTAVIMYDSPDNEMQCDVKTQDNM